MNEIEPQVHYCLIQIARENPAFTVALMRRIVAMAKVNLYPLSEREITDVIDQVGEIGLPLAESIPLEELSYWIADRINDPNLAKQVLEFEPLEAFLLLCVSEIAACCRRDVRPESRLCDFFPAEE